MNIKIPKYPIDFYDFSNGVDVDDKTINKWIKRCIKELEKEPESNYYYISSGNTLVCVFRNSEEDYGKYTVQVSKNYHKRIVG